jgi:predicted DNA-binding antitoxin AbrB/MazE fold protein
MAIVVEAVYQNGVLKPAEPLPLKENQTVQLTVQTELSWAQRTAGLIRWTGDAETLERIALDPEFGVREAR